VLCALGPNKAAGFLPAKRGFPQSVLDCIPHLGAVGGSENPEVSLRLDPKSASTTPNILSQLEPLLARLKNI